MRKDFMVPAIALGLLFSSPAIMPAAAQAGSPEWKHGMHDRGDMRGGWKQRGGRDGGHMMRWAPRDHSGMLRLMIILADTDGNGSLSLEEVQAVHARIFKAVDADGDGQVTLEEMQAFFRSLHGGPGSMSDDDDDEGAAPDEAPQSTEPTTPAMPGEPSTPAP